MPRSLITDTDNPNAPVMTTNPLTTTTPPLMVPAEPLPTFTYNAAPWETVRPSVKACAACLRVRGHLYTTPDGLGEVCPWCLASGAARERFPDAIMNDCDLIVSTSSTSTTYGDDDGAEGGENDHTVNEPAAAVSVVSASSVVVSPEAHRTLLERTPRFIAWQCDIQWWTHCGDVAVYRGMGGWDEIQALGPHAAAYFEEYYRREFRGDAATWPAFARRTGRDYDRTAYLFSCRHCKACGGYIDMKSV